MRLYNGSIHSAASATFKFRFPFRFHFKNVQQKREERKKKHWREICCALFWRLFETMLAYKIKISNSCRCLMSVLGKIIYLSRMCLCYFRSLLSVISDFSFLVPAVKLWSDFGWRMSIWWLTINGVRHYKLWDVFIWYLDRDDIVARY